MAKIKKYFDYTRSKKKRDYYVCFAEFLDALAHFSNVKYIKYELDFDDSSEDAIGMFRETYGYTEEPLDKKSEAFNAVYPKLMKSLYSCDKRCHKLATELNGYLAENAKNSKTDDEIVPDERIDQMIDYLSFTPTGIHTDARVYNVCVPQRDEKANFAYLDRLNAVYAISQERKNAGKMPNPVVICNIYHYEKRLVEAREKLKELLEK